MVRADIPKTDKNNKDLSIDQRTLNAISGVSKRNIALFEKLSSNSPETKVSFKNIIPEEKKFNESGQYSNDLMNIKPFQISQELNKKEELLANNKTVNANGLENKETFKTIGNNSPGDLAGSNIKLENNYDLETKNKDSNFANKYETEMAEHQNNDVFVKEDAFISDCSSHDQLVMTDKNNEEINYFDSNEKKDILPEVLDSNYESITEEEFNLSNEATISEIFCDDKNTNNQNVDYESVSNNFTAVEKECIYQEIVSKVKDFSIQAEIESNINTKNDMKAIISEDDINHNLDNMIKPNNESISSGCTGMINDIKRDNSLKDIKRVISMDYDEPLNSKQVKVRYLPTVSVASRKLTSKNANTPITISHTESINDSKDYKLEKDHIEMARSEDKSNMKSDININYEVKKKKRKEKKSLFRRLFMCC